MKSEDRWPAVPDLDVRRYDELGAVEIAARTHARVEAQQLRLARERAAAKTPAFNPFAALNTCRGLLLRALDSALHATGAARGNIQLFDTATGSLRLVVHRGFESPFLDFFAQVRPHHAACGEAWEAARAILVDDVTDSVLFDAASLEVMLDARARTVISCPFPGRGDGALGVLSVHAETPRTFGTVTLDHIDRIVSRLSERVQHALVFRAPQTRP